MRKTLGAGRTGPADSTARGSATAGSRAARGAETSLFGAAACALLGAGASGPAPSKKSGTGAGAAEAEAQRSVRAVLTDGSPAAPFPGATPVSQATVR